MSFNSNNITQRKTTNKVFKIITQLLTWGLILFFLILIIFIIVKSVPGIEYYGFNNIIFNNKFNINDPNSKDASVWLPLAITFLISIGALILAIPIAIKTATFIKFRIKNEKLQKWLRIIIETTSGIPSVIFGLFASQSLGLVVKEIFGLNTTYTILTAIFMLSFMIIPTITSLTLNAYDNTDISLINSSTALGFTNTKAIYKIFKKECRGAIIIATIIALGRAIGETMAVSMILESMSFGAEFNNGFISVLKSDLMPLGAVISRGLFAENGSAQSKSLLFFYGLILFIVVMIINVIVLTLSSKRVNSKNSIIKKINTKINLFFGQIINNITIWFDKLAFKNKYIVTKENYETELSKAIGYRSKHNKWNQVYTYWKLFWEIICFSILFSFIGWIILDIFIKGFGVVNANESTIFSYSKDTTGMATLNTLLLIIITTIICLPLALFIAIYLNEYCKNKFVKKTSYFFIDSLGATPSIIFGMFGLVFFIETLGISMVGASGQSLLAGSLTIGIVILPNLIRTIQQGLERVPLIIRDNGLALGCSRHQVVMKLVLPLALKSVISGIILAIGRILSETAPLYLTAGLTSANTIAILNPGQTLTTRIYAQLTSSSSMTAINVMYDAALSTILLLLFITILGYVLIPYYKVFLKEIKNRIEIWKLMKQNNLSLLKKQNKHKIYNNKLLINENDIEKYQLNPQDHKYIMVGLNKVKLIYPNK